MSWDAGEAPRCGRCGKPKELSEKSQQAVDAFWRLASRRVWDGMSGAPRPLPMSEIRGEASCTEDPDATTARVLILDSLWVEQTAKRLEAQRRREQAKSKSGRRR